MTAPPGQAEQARPGGRQAPARSRVLVQYALLAGPLLSMLDSSIVNVAVELAIPPWSVDPNATRADGAARPRARPGR